MLTNQEIDETTKIIGSRLVKEFEKVLKESRHHYEFKEVPIDSKFKLSTLDELGSQGWKFCFCSKDLGLDSNSVIMQRAKEGVDTMSEHEFEEKDEETTKDDETTEDAEADGIDEETEEDELFSEEESDDDEEDELDLDDEDDEDDEKEEDVEDQL